MEAEAGMTSFHSVHAGEQKSSSGFLLSKSPPNAHWNIIFELFKKTGIK